MRFYMSNEGIYIIEHEITDTEKNKNIGIPVLD